MTTGKKRPIFRKKKEEKEKKEDIDVKKNDEYEELTFDWTVDFDDVFSSGEEDNN